jgi:hypothetical protein
LRARVEGRRRDGGHDVVAAIATFRQAIELRNGD